MSVAVALTTAVLALFCWCCLLVRMVYRQDRRRRVLAMPIVGILASLGTLASAVGFAQLGLDRDLISAIASVGRGALASGGLLALRHFWRGY